MKESTKTAIDEILANMPKDLNKNTQIRYVYLELAKKFRKDIAFFYGTDEEKSVIYPKDPKVDFSNQETLEIICRSSALIYKYVFSKIGVDVQLVEKPTKFPFQHVDLIITGEDDKKYYLSPMEDLFRIQLGMRTKRFGSKTDKFNDMENVGELSSFSEEEVKEMDNKLGYTYKGTYMDDVVTNESKKGYVKTADIADYMLKHDYQFIKDSKRVLETGNEEIGETPEL